MHHVPGRCAPFGRCPWTDVVVHAPPRPRCRTSGKGVRFQRSGCRTANGQGVVFGRHIQKGLAQYKSNCSQLRTTDLEQENDRLRKRIRTYEDVISHNNLWGIFFETQSKNNGERHSIDILVQKPELQMK